MLFLLFLYLYVCGICTYEYAYSCVCRFQAHTDRLCRLLSAIFIEAGSLSWTMNTLTSLDISLLCYFSFVLPVSWHNWWSIMPTWHLQVFWGSELWSSHFTHCPISPGLGGDILKHSIQRLCCCSLLQIVPIVQLFQQKKTISLIHEFIRRF